MMDAVMGKDNNAFPVSVVSVGRYKQFLSLKWSA